MIPQLDIILPSSSSSLLASDMLAYEEFQGACSLPLGKLGNGMCTVDLEMSIRHILMRRSYGRAALHGRSSELTADAGCAPHQ